ncbi:MAG: UDP-N-acetylmuramate--L-alanine ligase [Anaerolineae bacterium]|nr:UDP-N-acetylmuramate--L-alanine ligase [Anaerolineae bacterium]
MFTQHAIRNIHIIGIGGIGLSAIARVLLARGVRVSGSDQVASSLTDELARLGATIHIGHCAENIGDAEMVLVTSAASDDNPEIVEARRRGVRIVKRNEFLRDLTHGKKTIAIAGTHGKTTTTAMIATILVNAGHDPDVIVGGIVPELGGNARAGRGDYFVIEADEYDRAFLGLLPYVAVVTSIEMDHPDVFRDVDDVTRAFREFIRQTTTDGVVIGYGDSPRVVAELQGVNRRTVRYGLDAMNDWRARAITPNARGGSDFVVWRGEREIGDWRLEIPGEHNVLNALAAIATTDALGIDLDVARTTLAQFRGVSRRFEIRGEFGGVIIVDDYAHHPTEIRATLAAARARFPQRTLWAVFQSHTFSRTRALLDEFARAFDDADHVIVTEIYAARERESYGVSGADIVARMTHRDARFIASLEETSRFLRERVQVGDVLITLGAGDVNRVGEIIARERGV